LRARDKAGVGVQNAAVNPPRIIEHRSPNYDARTRTIELVVLHYTGMQDARAALQRLCDPAPLAGHYPGPWQSADTPRDSVLGRVSAHYVVDERGDIFRLVNECDRAWHAGASSWKGEGDVNSRSIGVEIVNGGHDFDLPDYPTVQIDAVIALLQRILPRWSLSSASVVGHSDVAPGRKLDPGEKFPWRRLAQAGVALWPSASAANGAGEADFSLAQRQLRAFGYGIDETGMDDAQTRIVVEAFQRRFRPHRIDGVLDIETRQLLQGFSQQP
jgi:N-acetylmuramoyl-L-alanine amidase